MKSFTKNADNFIFKDINHNAEVNKSANLANILGYSDQQFARIKAFAQMQFLDGIFRHWCRKMKSSPSSGGMLNCRQFNDS